MQGQSASPGPRASLWWTAALILGLVLACYFPALRGGFLWDDDAHVTRPGLRSLAGLWQIWASVRATQQYYPLLHSAFWVEHRLWGDSALGYHLVNVLLHATSALLLVIVLRRLNVPGARLAGILFAVHPVCVESVAWISEQKNTLSLVFYLLSALAYLGFDANRGRQGARWSYVLAFLLFIAALLTKSVTATLPAALLVVLWWKRGRLTFRDAWPLVPWFVAGISGGLFTALVERKLIGAEGAAFDLSLVERCLLAGRVIWFYLEKLAWPSGLVFVYPRWDVRGAAPGWAGYLAAAALVTAALWLLRRRSRGPLAAWLFFVGSLFPALGFFNVYPFFFSYVADHFQYLASIGPLSLAAAAIAAAQGRVGRGRPLLPALCCGALVAGLGALTARECPKYADSQTLWRSTIAANPGAWMARNNLGAELMAAGRVGEAAAQIQESLALQPDNASAQTNLGNALIKLGRPAEALEHYARALEIAPRYPTGHNELGAALLRMGRTGEAIAHFQAALEENPAYANARVNLGSAYLQAGRAGDAAAQFEAALALDPGNPGTLADLGAALAGQGRLAEAAEQFRRALAASPNSPAALTNLGNVLLQMGRRGEAIARYQESLRADPDSAVTHNDLAYALLQEGRPDEAIAHCRRALDLRPDYPEARRNLEAALAAGPRPPQDSPAR
ncbi:MAG: tetratricopeptide repeat protein [Opitutaceae bacterium]